MMAREWVWGHKRSASPPRKPNNVALTSNCWVGWRNPLIANMAAFLASDYAVYITGETYNVSGGLPLSA